MGSQLSPDWREDIRRHGYNPNLIIPSSPTTRSAQTQIRHSASRSGAPGNLPEPHDAIRASSQRLSLGSRLQKYQATWIYQPSEMQPGCSRFFESMACRRHSLSVHESTNCACKYLGYAKDGRTVQNFVAELLRLTAVGRHPTPGYYYGRVL